MRKIRQIDIANALNISRVTVTKALQNSPEISKSTRELVRAKAEEMAYFPNFTGRNLSLKKTFTIGLVVPKIAHSFFCHSVQSFYEAAIAKGYYLIPTISFENHKTEERNIRILLSMGVDGIIIDPAMDVKDTKVYDLISESGAKFIFYDRYPLSYNHSRVVCDNRSAAKNVVSLLIAKGITQIVHFTCTQKLNIGKHRLEGYQQALKSAGLKYNRKLIVNTGLDEKDGYTSFIEYYNKYGCPKGVFAINDPVAIGIYRAAETLKLRIPDDFAIVGFSDTDKSQMLEPKLTTVHIPVKQMCIETINRLISMIEDKPVDVEKIFETELVIRNSV